MQLGVPFDRRSATVLFRMQSRNLERKFAHSSQLAYGHDFPQLMVLPNKSARRGSSSKLCHPFSCSMRTSTTDHRGPRERESHPRESWVNYLRRNYFASSSSQNRFASISMPHPLCSNTIRETQNGRTRAGHRCTVMRMRNHWSSVCLGGALQQ